MIFSSYAFIFIFFPITIVGFSLLKRLKNPMPVKAFLVLCSLGFYGQGDLRFLPVLLFTALVNLFAGRFLSGEGGGAGLRRLVLALALIENLGLLFYFKYTNFFLENVNRFAGTDFILKGIILPLGISFYTFQIMAYVLDCYRREAPVYPPLDYLLFVTFFPQLIVGPVVRHGEIIPQLEPENLRKTDGENIMRGLLYFSMGCAKKILIANPLILFAQSFYANMADGFFGAWAGVLAFTFAYYFDFSGYIDMALGLGRFFNITLPANFDSPYKARNFADFWKRWNITVSAFLNEQIFARLFHFGNGFIRLCLAILATFAVSGLWHGAGWHFIIWGLVNGLLVCLAHAMTLSGKRLPFPLAWALTFFFCILARVLFDSTGMTQALAVYRMMFDVSAFAGFVPFLAAGWHYVLQNAQTIVTMLIAAAICFGFKNSNEIVENATPKARYAVLSGLLLALSLLSMSGVSTFLYFQF